MARVERALAAQTRVFELRPRLLEREDRIAVALPPWALDPAQGECTTLVFLAPVPTQLVLRMHPWPNLPSGAASSAGAIQVTRCGAERISLLDVRLELRSPRALVRTLVAIGASRPTPLEVTLPERDSGAVAEGPDPGPAPARAPLAARLRSFELAARQEGAIQVEARPLRAEGAESLRLTLGCYRLLATTSEPAAYRLVQGDADAREPLRFDANDAGELRRELCVARERVVAIAVEAPNGQPPPTLALARFPLPAGLPGRFGPELGERLAEALGATRAPTRLGLLVFSTLGAQGRTPLPRTLLPGTCYLAVAALVRGDASALSLAAVTGAWSGEATSSGPDAAGVRLGFCTGKSGQAALDVEARGLGVAWLLNLFQLGPAHEAPSAPAAGEARP